MKSIIRLPQARGEGKSAGGVEDIATAEALTPASHNVNATECGAYPFVPSLVYPVPVHVPCPYTSITSHRPHRPHPCSTSHNSPLQTKHPHFADSTTTNKPVDYTIHVLEPPRPQTPPPPPPYKPLSTPQPLVVRRNAPNKLSKPHPQPVESIARPPTPPPTPFMSNTTTQTQGSRYGINNLLEFESGAYPFIDWVITQDLSFSLEWVRARSTGGRCQSVQFHEDAVSPPVHGLVIHPKDANSLLGQAMRRWGEIKVQRFDHFITVGDVLHSIWSYFQIPLTLADQQSIASGRVGFANEVQEFYWKRCGGRDSYRRCDALLHSLKFAGMEINYDFDTKRVLYLSLRNVY